MIFCSPIFYHVERLRIVILNLVSYLIRWCYDFNAIVSNERQYHVFQNVKKAVCIYWVFAQLAAIPFRLGYRLSRSASCAPTP